MTLRHNIMANRVSITHRFLWFGIWIREAGILAPLVISELLDDFKQQRRWIRMASVATAILSQGEYTYRVHQQREETRVRQEECFRP